VLGFSFKAALKRRLVTFKPGWFKPGWFKPGSLKPDRPLWQMDGEGKLAVVGRP